MQSHLKLYYKPAIGLTVAWKPFPKLYCVLNILTMSRLALDSPKSDPVDEVKSALGFYSHLIAQSDSLSDTCREPSIQILFFLQTQEWDCKSLYNSTFHLCGIFIMISIQIEIYIPSNLS